MLQTSKSWDEAINANARTNDVQVKFQISPAGATENATITANSTAAISNLEQLKNDVWNSATKFTTLERNLWILDDTMTIPPPSVDYWGNEVGYWSEIFSTADGAFGTSPVISIVLNTDYNLVGLSLGFNNIYNEFATEFDVEFQNAAGVVLGKKTTTNNQESFVVVDLMAENVKKINLTFKKWCLPYRRCRLLEFVAGKVKLFTSKEIISFELNDNVSIFDSAFDCPNFSLTVDNSNGEFDVLNPQGIFAYLTTEMKFSASFGTLTKNGMEWVTAGDFYLYEIPTSQQRETATFNCKPKIGLCSEIPYVSDNYELTTVQEICNKIFTFAKIDLEKVIIPPEVAAKVVNSFGGDNLALTDAFSQIAIAAGCFWKIHRKGNYELIPISTIFENIVNEISYDSAFSKPAITRQDITSASVAANYFKTYSWSGGYENWTSETITESLPNDDGGNVKVSSVFIRFGEDATEIAQLALAYFNQHPLTFQTECRGDPAIESGDVVLVETDYGSFPAIITEQKIEFSDTSFLKSSMAGRG